MDLPRDSTSMSSTDTFVRDPWLFREMCDSATGRQFSAHTGEQ